MPSVHRLHVAQAVLVERQREVVADVRVGDLHHQAVAEDVPVGELVRLRHPGLPPARAEVVPVHADLAVGRLERPKVRGVARVAHLLGGVEEHRDLVVRERLHRHLRVVVVQQRRVAVEAVADVLDRDGGRVGGQRRLHRLARRVALVEVVDPDVDVLLAVAAPEPRAPPHDRAAGLEAVVGDVLDRVARRRALPAQRVVHVDGLELLVGEVVAARARSACRCRSW